MTEKNQMLIDLKNILIVMLVTASISAGGVFSFLTSESLPSAMHDESPKVLGHVEYKVFGPDGNIKEYLQADNLVVTNGDNSTVNKMFGVSRTVTNSGTIGPFIAIGVGTGSTGPFTTDTALGVQQGHKTIATTSITTATHGQVTLTGVFNPGKITNSTTQTITESGVFDNTATTLNSNSTNMYARQTFSGITIASSDTLQVTWNITIT
jgi:hypothetical protein